MRKICLYFFALLVPSSAMGSECFQYEPVVTKLTGVVVQKTFPGAPNYEDISKGDKPEVVWLLQLPKAVCVWRGKDPLDEEEKGVSGLQLVPSSKLTQNFRDFLGKKVSVSGTLFHSHTGHHHTKVLLGVSEVTPDLSTIAPGHVLTAEDPIKTIQDIYESAQQHIRRKDYQAAHFKSIFDQGVWRKGDGKPHEGEDYGEWADVYSQNGTIFYVRMDTLTPSGDWSCMTEYYFRDDQSLAFAYTEHRTFASLHKGGILAAIRQYYNHGKLLRETEQQFDLANQRQPVPKEERGYFKNGCPFLFKTVGQFPFYSQLKRQMPKI